MATPEGNRKLGWSLIGGGLLGAALSIFLIVVGATSTPRQNILIVVASFFLLLPTYLVGYGIKKIFNAESAT